MLKLSFVGFYKVTSDFADSKEVKRRKEDDDISKYIYFNITLINHVICVAVWIRTVRTVFNV